MTVNPDAPRGKASLEVLRAEAHQELDTVIHERLLAGEDPWAFMEELPTVDELVVYLLRADAINANGGQHPSPTREYRVLRQIALEHPALTTTVWRMLGHDELLAPRTIDAQR
ncbi:tryptophan synthase subunit alpha [Cryobacterium tepidiphilum]|uniref:Tryptophan synthase subunit alpha n=1 Tax=Cryobacterium tepidiphilum TaxID=2486026 RepID=A0A3M8LF96_9MICO|nr:tryptophan synthase subunit alpha [Cryobacterium tepidiphilum]RNE63995.1 tryptophan synthase subunit alpha [Cryobacterium tepidiphilum]